MADIITVQVRLDARSATRQLNQFQNQVNRTAGGRAGNINDTNRQIERTNKSIARSTNLLRLYASAWIGVSAALTALREIGTVQNLERAISTVTDSTDELNATWDRLTDISLRTRSDLEANVTLFQRLSFSTEQMGTTTEEVERVVVALAAGLRLGGATAQESASSLRQLSQAFSKGKLDGDEFRSVMENAGFLMVRFSEAIGVTVGELIEMSRSGELTREVMTKGFLEVADVMENTLAAAPRTVDDALNDLRTTWLNFVRTLETSGAAVAIIDAISTSLKNWAGWISDAREELVRLGSVESGNVEESIDRRNELSRRLTKELQQYEKIKEQAERISSLQGVVGQEQLREQETRISNVARELALETQRFAVHKETRKEEEKRVSEAEQARKALEKDAEMQRQLQKQREEEKAELDRLSVFQEGVKLTEDAIKAESKIFEDQRKKEEQEREEFLKNTEQYADRLVGEQIAFGETLESQKNALQKFAETGMEVEDVFVNAVKGMEDALVEFVTTGKLDFQSLVDSMIADIARLVIQQNITRPLAQSLGNLFNTTGTTTTPVQPAAGTSAGGLGGLIGTGFNFLKGLLPFQHGGSFTVGGKSGIDKNLVAFRATKGETVTVAPKGNAGGINIVMNVTTQDAASFGRNQDQIMNMLQAKLASAQRNL